MARAALARAAPAWTAVAWTAMATAATATAPLLLPLPLAPLLLPLLLLQLRMLSAQASKVRGGQNHHTAALNARCRRVPPAAGPCHHPPREEHEVVTAWREEHEVVTALQGLACQVATNVAAAHAVAARVNDTAIADAASRSSTAQVALF